MNKIDLSKVFDELFPINRSILGPGYIKSLNIVKRYINFSFLKYKSGKKIFENSKYNWELEYVEKKSLTNEESFLLNIKNIKKKIKKKT